MSYKTIDKNLEDILIEKKSKFIGKLYKVETKEEIEEIHSKLKKQYYDSKHICFAYRLLEKNEIIERYSDDGEPQGTAGKPLLNILKAENLVNCFIVVIRYFGGILLGTGGLVHAYSSSLTNLLDKAEFVQFENGHLYEIQVDYSQIDKLKFILEKANVEIRKIQYDENIRVLCGIKKEFDLKKYLEKVNIIPIKLEYIGDTKIMS